METTAADTNSSVTHVLRRPVRRLRFAPQSRHPTAVSSQRPPLKGTCDDASNARRVHQLLHSQPCSAPFPASPFHLKHNADPSIMAEPPAISAGACHSPETPPASCTHSSPVSAQPFSCSTAFQPQTSPSCRVVDNLRLQLKQSTCRTLDAKENQEQLRLALQQVEQNQIAVLRALEEYRQLKALEGDKAVQKSLCDLEAENALLRAEVLNRKVDIRKKDEEIEKLSQRPFDISYTVEDFQEKHLALPEHAKEAELSTVSKEFMFPATSVLTPLEFPASDAPLQRSACCDENCAQGGICSSTTPHLPPSEGSRFPQRRAAHEALQPVQDRQRQPPATNALSQKNCLSWRSTCNRTSGCKVYTHPDGSKPQMLFCETSVHQTILPPSQEAKKYIVQLQEENAMLRKALLEASAAVDESAALLRKKDKIVEKMSCEDEDVKQVVRKQRERLEDLLIEMRETKQLLHQKEREVKHFQDKLLREELARASSEQVAAKLNGRVTALLLQLRHLESRYEETESTYQSKICSLERKLTAISPPVCVEAQTQTTPALSSSFPLSEFVQLSLGNLSSLTFDMKKRLTACEQKNSDRLLEHERLLGDKQLELAEFSARLASSTEAHAAEKKKLHERIVQLEGQLTLSRNKVQTLARKLEKMRCHLYDAYTTRQTLAAENEQEIAAKQLVISHSELRLRAEKEKLQDALGSLGVLQKHLRKALQCRAASTTSTQASQTEEKLSVIFEVPAEFQKQLDLLSTPNSPATCRSLVISSESHQHKERDTIRTAQEGDLAFQPPTLHCKNIVCVQFVVDAGERICMLTAALLCKTHELTVANERLEGFRQELKMRYTPIGRQSEEHREQQELNRRLLRAQVVWQEKIISLKKQNESLLQEKNEAIEKNENLHAREAKLEQEIRVLHEQQSLCRKQLEALHRDHSNRAARERSEHEEFLQLLKHHLAEGHPPKNSNLQPRSFSSGESTHIHSTLPESTAYPAAEAFTEVMDTSSAQRPSLPLQHHSALRGSMHVAGTDLLEAIHQLIAAATALVLRRAKVEPSDVCANPSGPPCRYAISGCDAVNHCLHGQAPATGNQWMPLKIEGSTKQVGPCHCKEMHWFPSCSRRCCLHSFSTSCVATRSGRQRVVTESQEPSCKRERIDEQECVESAMQKNIQRNRHWCAEKSIETESMEKPSLSYGRKSCLMREAVDQQLNSRDERKRLGCMRLATNAADVSAVNSEEGQLLEQMCDLFLFTGHRLASAEYAAATNEVVAALTYERWQLEKARATELIGDRALLRYNLQFLKHQLCAREAASNFLASGLCRLYRTRCDELKEQEFVLLRQLRLYEEEHRRQSSTLKEKETETHALQQRLAWLEAGKAELELLAESTAEERAMRRLATFKEKVLESLQTDASNLPVTSLLPPSSGGRVPQETSDEKISQLSDQLTQGRREKAALHFALKEMEQENKMMLLLLDQKDKQLTLLHEMKVLRPVSVKCTVETESERDRLPATSPQQDIWSNGPSKNISHPSGCTDGQKQRILASSTAVTLSGTSCLRDLENVLFSESGVDACYAELLETLSRLKGVVHQQQADMHKQAEKLAHREVEAAGLRMQHDSLCGELNRHALQLKEAQTAREEAAHLRARLQEMERWASRLGHAHQAELNSMRLAQKYRLQQLVTEWEGQTKQQLYTLNSENVSLKSHAEQLCADTQALREQIGRYKEALQRHKILQELSHASLGALHAFQLQASSRRPKSVLLQKACGAKRNKPTKPYSVIQVAAGYNDKPGQGSENSVPLAVVKCLLQAFIELCVQLAECERQLLADLSLSSWNSYESRTPRRDVCASPRPDRLFGQQFFPREESVLRGQRMIIQWLHACAVGRRECLREVSVLASFSSSGLRRPSDKAAGRKDAVLGCASRLMNKEKEAKRDLSVLLNSVKTLQNDSCFEAHISRQAAVHFPPQQRRLLLNLKEGARELLSVLNETCQAVTTARCAQQLILEKIAQIKKAFISMQSSMEKNEKARLKRSNSSSRKVFIMDPPGSLDNLQSRKGEGVRRRSRKRYNSARCECRDTSSSDSANSEHKSLSGDSCCVLQHGEAPVGRNTRTSGKFIPSGRDSSSALREIQQLLHLVCSCGQEASTLMEKADFNAEALATKLGAVFYISTAQFTDLPLNSEGVDQQKRKRGRGNFSDKTFCRASLYCPVPCKSSLTSSNSSTNDVSSASRARSLTIRKGQRLSPSVEDKFRRAPSHTSPSSGSCFQCRSHRFRRAACVRTRRSILPLSKRNVFSRATFTADRSKQNNGGSISDGDRSTSSLFPTNKRTYSSPCRFSRCAAASATSRKHARNPTDDVGDGHGDVEVPCTGLCRRAYSENSIHKPFATSFETSATAPMSIGSVAGSAVCGRSFLTGSETNALSGKSRQFRQCQSSVMQRLQLQVAKPEPSTEQTRTNVEAEKGQSFENSSYSPLSLVAVSRPMKTTDTQSTSGRSSRFASPPMVRNCVKRSGAGREPPADPFDEHLKRETLFSLPWSVHSCSRKSSPADTACRGRQNPHANRGGEGSPSKRGEQGIGADLASSSELHDGYIRGGTLGAGIHSAKHQGQTAKCYSTSSDSYSATLDRSHLSGVVGEKELSNVSTCRRRKASSSSGTHRRSVSFGALNRWWSAGQHFFHNHQEPLCEVSRRNQSRCMKELLHYPEQHRYTVVQKKPSKQVKLPAKSLPRPKVAGNNAVQSQQQETKQRCINAFQAPALCVERPAWLPPLSECPGTIRRVLHASPSEKNRSFTGNQPAINAVTFSPVPEVDKVSFVENETQKL